jgi:lipopolysaccharide transport system ATP-binding protein
MDKGVVFEGVSKRFILRHERVRSFQETFLNFFHRRNGATEVFWALKDVSFRVGEGDTLGIIGENGSGKSTVLKLITRIIEPTAGRVSVAGKVSALLELGAGFHPDLTGRENIFLNGSILGMTRREMKERFSDIVEFAGLEKFIDTPVKHFSSGMYARLGFAVAVSVDPDILVVDEVLAVGDEAFQRKCMDKISDFKKRGKTIILVSHSLDLVQSLCDQALWLDGGVVRAAGESTEVVYRYLEWSNTKDRVRLEGARGRSQEGQEGASSRWGSREVELTQVELLNGAGERTTVFDTGEGLIARLHYLAHQPVERPVFGIAIHRADNLHIAGPNTRTSNFPITRVEGSGIVDYIVESLPLLGGHYLLSAAVYDYTCTHPYDHHDRLYPFTVQPRTVAERLGIFRLPSRWRHICEGVPVEDGRPGLSLP